MTEHDPIREWHAQKERVNELLTICNTARSGDMEPDVCLAALIVGGVDERLARMAIAACTSQAPTAKRLNDARAAIQGVHEALVRAGHDGTEGTLAERVDALVREHWRKLEAEHDATHAAGIRAERAEARAYAADASVAVAHDALSEAGVERFTTALGQGGPSKRALTLIERVRLLSSKVSDAEAEVVRLRSEVADVRKDRDNACHRVDVLEDELREAHEDRRSLAHVVDRQRAEARTNRNDPDHD